MGIGRITKKTRERIVNLFQFCYLFGISKKDLIIFLYSRNDAKAYSNFKRDILPKCKPLIIKTTRKVGGDYFHKKRLRITKEFIEKDKVMDYKYRKNMENEKENYKQLLDRLPNMDLDNMNIKFNKKICNLEIKDLKERIKIFDKLKQIFQIPEILYGDGEKLSEEVNHKTNKVLKILDDPKNQKDCKYFSWDFRGKLHQLLCNENLIYKKTNFYKIDEKEIFSLFEKNTKWIGLNKNQYEKLRLKRGFEVLLYEDYLKERIKCFLDSKCFTLKDFLVSCFKPYIEKDQVLFKDKLRSIDEVYVFDFNQAIIGTTVKGSRTAIGFNIHYPESLIRLIAGELNCNEVFSKKIFISFLQQSKILPKTIKVIL